MMDPTTALIVSAPPEWIPVLIALALLVKAWQVWVDRKKVVTTDLVNTAKPSEEIHKEPDVKG